MNSFFDSTQLFAGFLIQDGGITYERLSYNQPNIPVKTTENQYELYRLEMYLLYKHNVKFSSRTGETDSLINSPRASLRKSRQRAQVTRKFLGHAICFIVIGPFTLTNHKRVIFLGNLKKPSEVF